MKNKSPIFQSRLSQVAKPTTTYQSLWAEQTKRWRRFRTAFFCFPFSAISLFFNNKCLAKVHKKRQQFFISSEFPLNMLSILNYMASVCQCCQCFLCFLRRNPNLIFALLKLLSGIHPAWRSDSKAVISVGGCGLFYRIDEWSPEA